MLRDASPSAIGPSNFERGGRAVGRSFRRHMHGAQNRADPAFENSIIFSNRALSTRE